MVLHQTRVLDATGRGGCRGAWAAARLLQDDCEDEAVVNFGLHGDGLDSSVDVANLGGGGSSFVVDGAGSDDVGEVLRKPVRRKGG